MTSSRPVLFLVSAYTSLFQHKKLYTIILVNENDETMHWLEMVLGDIACLQLDTGTDSKVNSR